MSAEVIHGDCLDVMRGMPDASVDAVVTDPPYGLSFMGKDWDHGVPGVPFWREALRVAKPGAYLLAFGGTRTYHRLACAIEDAGFEVCDCLSWLYGSGFPKHKSKLKPAWEPIVMARKPAPRATLLNIDACRLEPGEGVERDGEASALRRYTTAGSTGFAPTPGVRGGDPAGRWPANVILDEDAAAALDEQSGEMRSTNPGSFQRELTSRGYPGGGVGQRRAVDHPPVDIAKPGYGDSGGASRFFYTAKASRAEREAGLDGFAVKPCGTMEDDAYEWKGGNGHAPHNTKRRNSHPTVKPVALMRWLVRLVTPPDGVVLDPFTGSGTTGIAAVLESRRFVGIEREAEYVAIARARIAHHAPQQLEIPA
jgi:site-specific DNA-methyltransferase (adenine-specific)